MRLSEAILLGSTALTPRPLTCGKVGSDVGCALGMAHFALGYKGTSEFNERNIDELLQQYPLLVADLPLACDCKPYTHYGFQGRCQIAHLFDVHIMERGDWTLERLAQWVDSIEPSEPDEFSQLVDVLKEEKVEVL